MLSIGVIPLLVNKLYSDNDQVRRGLHFCPGFALFTPEILKCRRRSHDLVTPPTGEGGLRNCFGLRDIQSHRDEGDVGVVQVIKLCASSSRRQVLDDDDVEIFANLAEVKRELDFNFNYLLKHNLKSLLNY